MTAQTPSSFFDRSPEAFDRSPEAQARRGRMKGDRTRLAKRYFADLYAAWEEQGPIVLNRAAFHDPMGFARMVAMLMPQKLEVSHPVDGMTDERLADLLELAERMASLKASGVVLTDEKSLIDITPERPGGGAESAIRAGGEGCPSTTRSAAAPETGETHNRLNDDTSTYADRPPVGKPCAPSAAEEERRNISKLTRDGDGIEPASLF